MTEWSYSVNNRIDKCLLGLEINRQTMKCHRYCYYKLIQFIIYSGIWPLVSHAKHTLNTFYRTNLCAVGYKFKNYREKEWGQRVFWWLVSCF